VLGAGALTGGAFETGVLAALQDHADWDAREADLIVGTSIGSIVGAALRYGLAPTDLYAYRSGQKMSPAAQVLFAKLGEQPALPAIFPRLRWPLPSARILMRAMRHPWRSRAALLAAALPRGRFPMDPYADVVRRLTGSGWPSAALWTVAAKLPSCERIVFGNGDCPECDVPDAVAASCAVPGLFAPVGIADGEYIDGGIHSPTNADLVGDHGFDTVVVVSPMSTTTPRPGTNPFRLYFRAMLGAEVRRLRRRGANVITFQPGPLVQRAMGLNAFDDARCPRVAELSYEHARAKLAHGTQPSTLAA
jgi:NTE family protein